MQKILKLLLDFDFVYLAGFCLFGIIIFGLFINYLFPTFGITDPLSKRFLWPVVLILIFLFIKLVLNVYEWIFEDKKQLIFKILIILNPILSAFGAFRLTNTGDEKIVIASIFLTIFLFVYVLLHGNLRSFKASIYSASLSLIFANTLRSNFLVGWDIHQEFLVFRLTSLANHWDIKIFRDAYNACLSITILPTILKNIFNIDNLSVFKIVYPLIIALIPLVVYSIGNKMMNNKFAYIGAFLFLIQIPYFGQLPALLRQSIAILFFALLVDVLLNKDISHFLQKLFYYMFGISMVLSHYSTTYIAIVFLVMVKIFKFILNKIFSYKHVNNNLSLSMLAVLIVAAFLWNALITDTSEGISNTFSKVGENISKTFSLENKSDVVKNAFYASSDNATYVNDYAEKSVNESGTPEKFSNFKIKPITFFSGNSIKISDPIPAYFHIIIPWIFRLSILFGVFILFIKRPKFTHSDLILPMSVSFLFLIVCIIALPFASMYYNFERLFQQTLLLLAPISVLGVINIRPIFKKIPIQIILPILAISYILQSTGVADHVFYQTKEFMLANEGEQFLRYFTTKAEYSGINWLDKYAPAGSVVYADKYTKLRFIGYSTQHYGYISNEINPPRIESFGYVFSGMAANVQNVVFANYLNQSVVYSFPFEYLNLNRNLIYSNNLTKIYR